MARNGVAALAAAVVASAVGVGLAHPAAAAGQTLISDTFTGTTVTGPFVPLTNTSGLPCLTASSNTSGTPIPGCAAVAIDTVGNGVLRLTDNSAHRVAGVVYGNDFPLAEGLRAEFKVYMWGGVICCGVGDGVSFSLAAAPPPPAQLGGEGGYLGYNTNGTNGLPAGYLGFGFDEYGVYPDSDFDAPGCTDPPGRLSSTQYPDSVSVRGPGNGATGYCVLSSSAFPVPASPSFSFHAGGRNSITGVQIVVDPDAGTYTVGIDNSGGNSYNTVTSGSLPADWYDQAGTLHSGRPDRVTFVLAGSSGTFGDNHEISDLNVVTLYPPATPPPAPPPSGPPPPPPPPPPVAEVNGGDQHHDSDASNDPSQHNDEGMSDAAGTATTSAPSVTTPCSGACTLAAQTTDTTVVITATDTAFHGTSTGRAPAFALTINGGGSEPRCPGYRNLDHDWVQFGFRGNAGGTFQKDGRITTRRPLTRSEAVRLRSRRQVCFEAPYRFAPAPGFGLGRHGGVFAGVLPECTGAAGPCVRSREVVRVGYGWGVRIVFYVPPNKRDPKALG